MRSNKRMKESRKKDFMEIMLKEHNRLSQIDTTALSMKELKEINSMGNNK